MAEQDVLIYVMSKSIKLLSLFLYIHKLVYLIRICLKCSYILRILCRETSENVLRRPEMKHSKNTEFRGKRPSAVITYGYLDLLK